MKVTISVDNILVVLHVLVRATAWILQMTGAYTTSSEVNRFVFTATIMFSFLHYMAKFVLWHFNERWFCFLGAGIKFTAGLLWSLNIDTTVESILAVNIVLKIIKKSSNSWNIHFFVIRLSSQ